jgi:tetratricopeptide (TPR) repeat protein/DNA-binding XRE family transcriptional regulator
MSEQFFDVLKEFTDREGKTSGQLAKMTGIHKQTIVSWLDGRVAKPRNWEDLLKIFQALRLNVRESNRLLQAAGQQSVHDLLRKAKAKDQQNSISIIESILENEAVSPVAPFQVPFSTVKLIGRQQLIEDVTEKLLFGGQICVMHGMGGVGKTVLAQQIAYECRPHFADGVLWAGLKPNDYLGGRVDEAIMKSIIDTFVEPYGRSLNNEYDLASRSRILRDVLANKNVLIIIDNAYYSEDIKYLLPSTTEKCSVLITTRNKKILRSGYQSFQVSPLGATESVDLLRSFLEGTFINWDEAAAIKIVELLKGLPLAIKLIGSNMADSPGATLNEYKELLENEKLHLDHLVEDEFADTDDASKSIRASFELSYQRLPHVRKRLFNSLAAFPSTDFSLTSIIAINRDQLPVDVKKHFGRLNTLSLLDIVNVGSPDDPIENSTNIRYHLHPLLHTFARKKLVADHEQLLEAETRVIDYFKGFAEKNRGAYKLLNEEWVNIVGLLHRAQEKEDWQTIYIIIGYLTENHLGTAGFLDARGFWSEAVGFLEDLLDVPFVKVSPHDQGRFTFALGALNHRLAKLDTAEDYLFNASTILLTQDLSPKSELLLAQICELRAQIAFARGQAEDAFALVGEGLSYLEHNQLIEAKHERSYLYIRQGTLLARIGELKEALPIIEKGIKDLPSEPTPAKVSGLMTLGIINDFLGRYDQAANAWEEGTGLAATLGDNLRLAGLWRNRAILAEKVGDTSSSIEYNENALQLYEQIGDEVGEAHTAANLGIVYLFLGDPDAAVKQIHRATKIAQEQKAKDLKVFANVAMARLLLHEMQVDEAESYLRNAEKLALDIDLSEILAEIKRLQALIALRRMEYEQATILIDESLGLASERNHLIDEGNSWRVKGTILYAMDQTENGDIAFAKSVELLADGYLLHRARAEMIWAKCLIERNSISSAVHLLNKAKTTLESMSVKRLLEQVKKLLNQIEFD